MRSSPGRRTGDAILRHGGPNSSGSLNEIVTGSRVLISVMRTEPSPAVPPRRGRASDAHLWYAPGIMTERTQSAGTGPPKPTKEDVVGLYRRAFTEFGSRALWNIRQYDDPTPEQMLAITRQLRTEGDANARRLAEQIEQAARAYL
jgi:hypothetical protein